MGTATRLLTVEEYNKIPNPPGGRYELHHGELVFVGFPTTRHNDIQARLYELLKPFASGLGVVRVEFPFRAEPEHELRGADVAFVQMERYRASDPTGWLMGAPELVIEVLSPSNTAAEMFDKAELCLANGAVQFWEINPKSRSVRVTQRNSSAVTYRPGQTIPLDEIFGQGQLAVDDIFSPTAE